MILYKTRQKIREYLFRRKVLKCGRDLQIFGHVYVNNGKCINIGDNLRINEGVKLFGRTGCSITIGNDVTISPNSTILCSQYDIRRWIEKKEKVHISMDTVIGDHVWICSNVVINGGVKITGEYIVIASGSVVTNNLTESYCIYAGNPAKVVKKLVRE